MRILLFAFIVLCTFSCKRKQSTTPIGIPEPRNNKVVILTETQGFRHPSISNGVEMFKDHTTEWDIEVAHFDSSQHLSFSNLSDYAVLVLLNTTGDFLNDAEQNLLVEYIRNGGAVMGIHAATDAEYSWGWYNKLMGAQFDGHPAIQNADCIVNNAEHGITQGLPQVWNRTDEWYNFKNLQADNNVLITLDENTYMGGTHGNTHPISWYRTFDGGRVFYTGMGHTEETYGEPLFKKQIQNALNWLME